MITLGGYQTVLPNQMNHRSFCGGKQYGLFSTSLQQQQEQAAQGSGGVTIPGGVQKTCSYCTSGHGLSDMVVLGGWLDLMILEVFSKFNDSMTQFWIPVLGILHLSQKYFASNSIQRV